MLDFFPILFHLEKNDGISSKHSVISLEQYILSKFKTKILSPDNDVARFKAIYDIPGLNTFYRETATLFAVMPCTL